MAVDPYVYPGTRVLRNRLEITDEDELARVEARVTLIADLDLAERPEAGEYDLAHLQRIHRRLFSPIYAWAGELRTTDIAKDNALFCRAHLLEQYAPEVFARVERGPVLRELSYERVVNRLPGHLAGVDALHPFREGNGRATRAFFTQWGAEVGVQLNWADLDRDRNVAAYQAAFRGHLEPLRELVREIAEPIARRRDRGVDLGR
ncbi:Fic family protein [Patulibacter sp. NPDC049589]|uniref:Fic/DOC family protein n=1 Tax=Patulibacter sp. NPDC049589 TaxID=3154731 RepID=UPI0034469858